MTHIIQKQVLELTLDEGPEKTARQDDMARSFRESVLPAMNKLFDQLAPPGTVWKIESLEVDLGRIRPDNFENELIRKLREKLQLDFSPETGKNTLKVISHGQSLFEQFLFFLEFGHFSWNANGITLLQMEKEVPEILARFGETEKDRLLKVMASSQSRERFRKQFPLEFQVDITLIVLPYPKLKDLLDFFEIQLPRNLYCFLPVAALSSFALPGYRSNDRFTTKQLILRLLPELEKELGFSSGAKKRFRQQLLKKVRSQKNKIAATIVETLNKPQEARDEISGEREIITTEPDKKEPEAIYIKNAGIVLLWPYLQRFFENLDLLQENGFINRKAAEKAVCILQHLADPETEITENFLPLNKILCGLDVPEVIATDETEIGNEAAACNELIHAVIKNWQKIGNTSIKGFQTSFLQREGRLEKKDDGWGLKVEQRSFDMLLDSLPWSITLIKLPWTPKPLHVEW